ncbi:MAG: hypothetical protein ABI867_01505 [Kofleriaceae bacterium]
MIVDNPINHKCLRCERGVLGNGAHLYAFHERVVETRLPDHQLLAKLFGTEYQATAELLTERVDERRVQREHSVDIGDEPRFPGGPTRAIVVGRHVDPLLEVEVRVHERLFEFEARLAGVAFAAMKAAREDLVPQIGAARCVHSTREPRIERGLAHRTSDSPCVERRH